MAKIKFKDIKPDSRNTNKHTEYGMHTLDNSLEQVGIIESVTISNDNVIISGNARHEKIGQKFTNDAIIVETDGTTPVVIKRTDIESGTKEFHKASILANTVAQKNQNIDVELVEVLADEFEFEVSEVFVDVKNQESKIDYSILDDDDVQDQLNDMTNGVKKAIQIEFESEHYEEAYQLVKFWREQKLYIGGFLIEKLKAEKEKL
jgi:hypothetical protein